MISLQHLPFWVYLVFGGSYLDEFAPDLSRHHVAVPQVAHAEHEAQFPISLRNHRVLTEHERLCAFFRLGHFYEHTAYEKSVHYGAKQRLEQKQYDALRAFLGYVPVTVADGGLGLDEKKKR